MIAFSCNGWAVCPSCNTGRMVETAAHLSDLVLLLLPMRQLTCPFCHAAMRSIAFITEPRTVRQILDHLGNRHDRLAGGGHPGNSRTGRPP